MAEMKKPLRIVITTGDADGIGTEITAKALSKIKAQSGVTFLIWRSPKCAKRDLTRLDRHFKRTTVSSWAEALKVTPTSGRDLIDINSNLAAPIWVEMTAQASLYKHVDAMVTAPLSKTAINAAGLADMGHTGILKRVSKSRELFMGFVGSKFHVLLATGHLAIEDVPTTLTQARLRRAIEAANHMRAVLPGARAKLPLALIGLNPHAGEEGLIGSAEEKIHLPVLEEVRAAGLKIDGPLVPDAAFFERNWKKYSIYIANYHDQGLIPFKMTHGQESGIQLTMGLPFVRTSVDHGTAKDIFGKDKADPRSMIEAIEHAIRLCRAEIDLK